MNIGHQLYASDEGFGGWVGGWVEGCGGESCSYFTEPDTHLIRTDPSQ